MSDTAPPSAAPSAVHERDGAKGAKGNKVTPSSRNAPPASYRDLLVAAADLAGIKIDPDLSDGEAFRALYDVWVRLGKYRRGKPIRSVRRMKDWLGDEREIRSLETKLAGKTYFQRDDIKNLLHLYLDHWNPDPQTGEDRPYPSEDREVIAGRLADGIMKSLGEQRDRGLILPERSRNGASAKASSEAPGQAGTSVVDDSMRTREALVERYRDGDALITVSRERTFTGQNPIGIMSAFQDLMDALRKVDKEDKSGRPRALIWIADLGRLERDRRAQAALHNLDFIATQFKAFLMTDHPEKALRRQWFQKRAVVLVGTMLDRDIDRCYENAGITLPKLPDRHSWVTSDRLLLSGGVPHEWRKPFDERGITSQEQESITVHVDRTKRPAVGELTADDHGDIDYLLHLPTVGADSASEVRCISLPPLGVRFNDGFRVARDVALMRLGQQIESDLPFGPFEDLALLRRQRFAALTAAEFCELTTRLAFEDDQK